MSNFPEQSNPMDHPSQQEKGIESPVTAAFGTTKKGKRSVVVAVGVLALLLLLGSAAFLAGQMPNRPTESATGGATVQMKVAGKGGGQPKMANVERNPAKELPDAPPSAAGVFVRRDGNSVFVGTGRVAMTFQRKVDGSAQVGASYDGPVVEVVVTHDTVVYEDTTSMNLGQNSTATVQQTVKPGTADKVDANYSVTAWGQKRGDRIVADVLVYWRPGQ